MNNKEGNSDLRLYYLTVTDRDIFMNRVFGADCFAERLPHIFTKGIIVAKLEDSNYYTLNFNNGTVQMDNSTSFFTQEEIDECMSLKLIEV